MSTVQTYIRAARWVDIVVALGSPFAVSLRTAATSSVHQRCKPGWLPTSTNGVPVLNMCSEVGVANATTNENGYRIGESHHRAQLTDHEVELMRQLHEEGYGYTRLAKIFDLSRSAVRDICLYRHRSQTPAEYKQGTRAKGAY